jgi:HD-like signal output (HDOD) protein/CheY-like chemotaxis protein
MSLTDPVESPRRCVLFVDDEPHLLAALRRALRGQRDSWQMLFANSGAEALEMIDAEPVDAIVSDMRMPGMDGAALLAEVQLRSPATARIVLSGEADVGSVLAVARSAQQFLSKPCDVAELVAAVSRSLHVQSLLNDPGLRELIGGVTSLPALPASYQELVATMREPDVDLRDVTRIVAADVATSADLLKLVNSAFFGLPREIGSVASAVSLLGLDNIQALVLTGSVFRVNPDLARVLDVEQMQARAMRRAAMARAIATAEGWPAHERDVIGLACMLRDVGALVLAEGRPDAAARLNEQPPAASPALIAELERTAYGCTVAEASAYLLGLWGFSPAVVHVVASASTPPVTASGRCDHLLAFVTRRAHELEAVPIDDLPPEAAGYLSVERLGAWDAVVAQVTA